jgi:hypothetical protein
MRLVARLASTELTLLPGRSTTSRTTGSEYLFLAEFFFHVGRDHALKPSPGMLNLEQLRQLTYQGNAVSGENRQTCDPDLSEFERGC